MNLTRTQRELVLEAKQRRPGDWWPRGGGHVVLDIPGEPTRQEGYHEPGGSFSPSPGSFGVALWVLNPAGKVIATSDTIPLDQIEQHFVWGADKLAPSIDTTTPYYRCVWSVLKGRRPAGSAKTIRSWLRWPVRRSAKSGWELDLGRTPSWTCVRRRYCDIIALRGGIRNHLTRMCVENEPAIVDGGHNPLAGNRSVCRRSGEAGFARSCAGRCAAPAALGAP